MRENDNSFISLTDVKVLKMTHPSTYELYSLVLKATCMQ